MATLAAYSALDMTDIEVHDGEVIEATSTRITISDGYRTGTYTGTGFKYDNFGLIGGTVTGYRYYEGGVLQYAVSGVAVSALTAANLIDAGDTTELLKLALRGNDSLSGSIFDDVLRGFAANDTISGKGGADVLLGDAGDDSLQGNGGNDLLVGGAGKDMLTGGSGTDRFDFDKVADSANTGATRDVIVDFGTGNDRIEFSTIDAIAGGANDAFTYRGTANFTGLGQIKAQQSGDDTLLLMNTASTAGAEMAIVLKNFAAADLAAADFIL